MKIVLGLAGLVLAVFLVDRLLLWMEWKGWIDYRRTYPGRINPGQVGPAFLAIQGLARAGEAPRRRGADGAADRARRRGRSRLAEFGIPRA